MPLLTSPGRPSEGPPKEQGIWSNNQEQATPEEQVELERRSLACTRDSDLHRGFKSFTISSRSRATLSSICRRATTTIRSAPIPFSIMHDGQNLFDGRTSFVNGRTWEVREQADAAIEAGEVEPLIIVGIYNTGDRRLAEYTHERDWQMGGGEADSYGRLLTAELMPWIASHIACGTSASRRAWAALRWAGWLRSILDCAMRSFRQAGRAFTQRVVEPQEHSWLPERARAPIWERPKLWLDVGDREGHARCATPEHWTVGSRPMAGGPARPSTSRRCMAEPTMKASWARRVRPMLKFLFPARMGAACLKLARLSAILRCCVLRGCARWLSALNLGACTCP